MKKKVLILTATISLFIVLLQAESVKTFAKERYEDLQLFAKVLNIVQQYYVESVETKKLIDGAIKGMLSELDPHTNYLPKELYKEFQSETNGEFSGLGVEITVQKSVLTVISPIEDTPAWKAGIKAGDKIVKINGESTKGLSLAEAAQRMKGSKGTKITLTIFRDSFDEPKDFVIKRDSVKIKSVKYTDLEDGYAYVRITSFIEDTHKELTKILDKRKDTKGLIIDLRRNPGGLLDQAVKISDLFLEEGVIVSTVGRNEKEKEIIYAKKEEKKRDFAVVVLIDEYSASASEIVAGALQDNKRALVMGLRSFGKGSVQSVVKLGDGSALKLTVARYFTPSGKSIQAEGITPDVVVESIDSKALKRARKMKSRVRREKDMKNHLLGDKEKKQKQKKDNNFDFWWENPEKDKNTNLSAREKLLNDDYQVQQAYNYLRAYKVMKSM
ncbi:MAG: S41 family peptidase [Bdellovibrionales bacterium]|nr:S41 family peptidase [Bdellovibrionales bacterium]